MNIQGLDITFKFYRNHPSQAGETPVKFEYALQWRHNGCDSVSNHQPHHCLLNRLFRRRSKKTSKLHVTGLCAGNSPGTGEFPAQMASNAENVSIWWRHHGFGNSYIQFCNVINIYNRDIDWRDFNNVHPLWGIGYLDNFLRSGIFLIFQHREHTC